MKLLAIDWYIEVRKTLETHKCDYSAELCILYFQNTHQNRTIHAIQMQM